MRIALVHDYLAQDGGAERVLKAMHEIWPQAPIFVLIHDKNKIKDFPDELINESFISRLPFGRTAFQWYLPWMPLATESLNLKDFDVVISTSSIFAKGIITGPDTLHISYCHTPPRFLWADNYAYINDMKRSRVVKMALPHLLHRLRLWDRMSVDRVDHFVANSKTVQQRIHKYYRRESDVIYPPVDMQAARGQAAVGDYYAAGGRLVPYKRLDLVVKTFNRLRWPLKIFGTGSEFKSLRQRAKDNIEFLGQISDGQKQNLLRGARAFIHPQLEDFGITAIESMAAGRPVIAYSQGGATETVIPNETGQFFHRQSWESLLDALMNFNFENWDSSKICEYALKFSPGNFKAGIKKYVDDRYEEFRKGVSQGTLINPL